jgi:hypothetical protein
MLPLASPDIRLVGAFHRDPGSKLRANKKVTAGVILVKGETSEHHPAKNFPRTRKALFSEFGSHSDVLASSTAWEKQASTRENLTGRQVANRPASFVFTIL